MPANLAPADSVVCRLCAGKLHGLPVGINHAFDLVGAFGTSEFLSFVLESVIRSRRAPGEGHSRAAIRTVRLIPHAKVSRIPLLVPHNRARPGRFKNTARRHRECVYSRSDRSEGPSSADEP
jgi:hypothetical protein